MPEISRFAGLSIRMFVEKGIQHHLPHFHVYYQGQAASYRIDTIELIGGYIPLRQRRLIEAWAELHQEELLENWRRVQDEQRPTRIAPLA
jgi:hypothetical protein